MSSLQERLIGAGVKWARIKAAYNLLGLQSIQRGLNWEHNMVENDTKDQQDDPSDENDMGDIILGDRNEIHNSSPITKSLSPWIVTLLPTALAIASLAYTYFTSSKEETKIPAPTEEVQDQPEETIQTIVNEGRSYDLEFAQPINP